MKVQLILPDFAYKDSFLEAVLEFKAEDLDVYRAHNVNVLRDDSAFKQYVESVKEEAQGKHLKAGYVPHTLYWLVDGNEFIGQLDIRHYLNLYLIEVGGHIGYNIRPSKRKQGYGKLILQLGLEKARALGIDEVLVTCDVDNIGSRKIIEANNGQFIDITITKDRQGKEVKKRRYTINT